MNDLISRQEAIRLAEQGQIQGFEWQFKKLCTLPSAEPEPILDKIRSEIGELYINLTYEENSRRGASWGLRRALEIIDKYKSKSDIEELPSAEPERKTGKWISTYADCGGDVWVSWKCSNCGYVRKKGWKYTDDGKKPDALFCEICGADMRGEEG